MTKVMNVMLVAVVLFLAIGWAVCRIIDSPAQRGQRLFESTTFYVDYVRLESKFKAAVTIEDKKKRLKEVGFLIEKRTTLFDNLRDYLYKQGIVATVVEPWWYYNRYGDVVTYEMTRPKIRISASRR